jgi:hypothetical protein
MVKVILGAIPSGGCDDSVGALDANNLMLGLLFGEMPDLAERLGSGDKWLLSDEEIAWGAHQLISIVCTPVRCVADDVGSSGEGGPQVYSHHQKRWCGCLKCHGQHQGS